MSLTYEIVIIDDQKKSEISSIQSLAKAIGYSEKLWSQALVKEESSEMTIEDKQIGVLLKAQKLLGLDSAFSIEIQSVDQAKFEEFLQKLYSHLTNKLGFTQIKVVSDSVTEQISRELSPKLKEVENALRKALIKLSLKDDSFSAQYPASFKEKLKIRKGDKNSSINQDLFYADVFDLTEILNKTSLNTDQLQTKWSQYLSLKDRCQTYAPLSSKDLAFGQSLATDLLAQLGAKETLSGTSSNGSYNASKSTISVASPVVETAVEKSSNGSDSSSANVVNVRPKGTLVDQPKAINEVPNIVEEKVIEVAKPVVETITAVKEEVKASNPSPKPVVGYEIISENIFLQELKKAENLKSGQMINLKTFVTETLANLGYAAGPAYTASKNLNESGKVNIFESKDEVGLIVKAIKSI